jgi:hypothetical protein
VARFYTDDGGFSSMEQTGGFEKMIIPLGGFLSSSSRFL